MKDKDDLQASTDNPESSIHLYSRMRLSSTSPAGLLVTMILLLTVNLSQVYHTVQHSQVCSKHA